MQYVCQRECNQRGDRRAGFSVSAYSIACSDSDKIVSQLSFADLDTWEDLPKLHSATANRQNASQLSTGTGRICGTFSLEKLPSRRLVVFALASGTMPVDTRSHADAVATGFMHRMGQQISVGGSGLDVTARKSVATDEIQQADPAADTVAGELSAGGTGRSTPLRSCVTGTGARPIWRSTSSTSAIMAFVFARPLDAWLAGFAMLAGEKSHPATAGVVWRRRRHPHSRVAAAVVLFRLCRRASVQAQQPVARPLGHELAQAERVRHRARRR